MVMIMLDHDGQYKVVMHIILLICTNYGKDCHDGHNHVGSQGKPSENKAPFFGHCPKVPSSPPPVLDIREVTFVLDICEGKPIVNIQPTLVLWAVRKGGALPTGQP